MIEYRSFLNADPPKLLELWHACGLGRGAAKGFTCFAFDSLNFSQPYFDPRGLILAIEDQKAVGFVHAGFGCSDDESSISHEAGVICAVMVHPDYRRQGIGKELVARAENYLKTSGTSEFKAGSADPNDPFYFGIYGGCQPAGFLESDPNAAPFFEALGYKTHERRLVFQREISEARDPTNFRLVNIRRQMKLAIVNQPKDPSWWWLTRLGRLDSLRFLLIPKNGGEPVAGATIVGLDLFLQTWGARAIGITELFVVEEHRRKGYGQTLLIEIARRLRQEMVSVLEAHASEMNSSAIGAIVSAGFTQVDTGSVFRKIVE